MKNGIMERMIMNHDLISWKFNENRKKKDVLFENPQQQK